MERGHRLNITGRFIIYLLLTAIIPLLVVSVTSYAISKSVIQKRVSSYALELSNKQKDYMDLMLDEVGSLIANISSVDEIKTALTSNTDNSDDYIKLATQAKIGYILSGYTNLRGLISIDIFSMNGTHYHVGDTLNIKDIRNEVKERIYNEASLSDGIVWTGVEDNVNANSKNFKVITAAKVLKEFDTKNMKEEPIGIILVNYSIDSIYEHFQQSYLGQDAYMIVVDNKQRIVYHPDRTLVGSVLDSALLKGRSADSPSYTVDVVDTEMFVTYVQSNLSNWTLYSFVPVKSLTVDSAYIRNSSLLVLLACAIFISLFALHFSRNVVNPLKKLTDQFKKLQDGDSESISRLEEKYNDEIGDLIRWFNTFLESLGQKRQAEEALRQSREQYRSVVENMKEGVFQTDINGNLVFLNPAWKAITGYSVESSLGDSLFSYIHPTERMECTRMLSEFFKKDEPFFQFQTRFVTSDNDLRIVEVFSSVTRDGSGNPSGLVGTMNDVTEQAQFLHKLQEAKELAEAGFMKTSEELRTEHQQLLDIIEFLPDATFVVNSDREVIAWNRAMEEMTGILKDQVLGQGDYIYAFPFYGRQTPIIIDSLFNQMNDVKYTNMERKGSTVYAEVFAPLLNNGLGAYLWVTASLLNNHEGIVTGAIQSIRDITERKHAEEALAAEKERLAVTLRSIGDGVITTDTQKRVLLLNTAAEQITGWDQEEAEGCELSDVLNIEKHANEAGGKPRTGDVKPKQPAFSNRKILNARDGTRKIITDNTSPIMDKNGKLLGDVLVFRDITEQNKLEAQLALSQKMESIGQLAAGIAHEINTPLQYVGDNTNFLQNAFLKLCQAIEGYRDLTHHSVMADASSKPAQIGLEIEDRLNLPFLMTEIPEALAQSLEGLNRVSQIVLAMKDFSHPGFKQTMYADLNKAIESTLVISRNEWKYLAEVETYLDPTLPLVNCVVDEINQVLLNMIINSAHAIAEKTGKDSPEKGKIVLKTSYDKGWVHISISDTGIGIPSSVIDKIFDPFFTTKDVGVGTGQGLALAHNIINNKHKGAISVESTMGAGTTFIVSLPIDGLKGMIQ